MSAGHRPRVYEIFLLYILFFVGVKKTSYN